MSNKPIPPSPGPYAILPDVLWLEDPTFHFAGGQRYKQIANVQGTLALVVCDEGDDECDATAELLKAAPAMLAALHAIAGCPQAGPWLARLPMAGVSHSVWEAMMAAIKLAEGD